jgi:hypothetical protein
MTADYLNVTFNMNVEYSTCAFRIASCDVAVWNCKETSYISAE